MKSRLVFIIGPTASGKTDLAIQSSLKTQSEIINADSVQVFEGLDIGSAKPTPDELRTVKHHLVGHIPKGQDYTSGEFRKDVLKILDTNPNKNFIIVGGSGFYLKGLTHGLFEIPDVPEDIHLAVRKEMPEQLYQELLRVDPQSAQVINPNDTYRIQRAIEVFRAFQKPLSQFKNEFKRQELPFEYIKIGLKISRDDLRVRVRQRVVKMIERGLIEETSRLIQDGFENWKALMSVGYKETVEYLKGHISRDDLVDEITKNTMGLAKRQMTWFRKDLEIEWFEALEDQQLALARVQNFLSQQS